MKQHSIIALLLVLGLLFTAESGVVAQSDLQGQFLLDGDEVTENTHDYGEGRFQMPQEGAKLIWGPNWDNSKKGQKRLFQENFKTLCDGPLWVHATADDEVKIYINGEHVLSGSDDHKIFEGEGHGKKCQKNKIAIEATNWDDDKLAGVIYQVSQDESCAKCPPGTHFNQQTCECECVQDCKCKAPRSKYFGFPDCSCGCQEKDCGQGKIQSGKTCECECINRGMCPEHQAWDGELCMCACPNKEKWCPKGQTFDEATCKCMCKPQICNKGQIFDEKQCKCVCPEKECPKNLWMNKRTCECECERKKWCRHGYEFDMGVCDCVCKKKECADGWTFNEDRCACTCDKECPENLWLNKRTCQCDCQRKKRCHFGFTFDMDACDCICVEKECNDWEVWNEEKCQCMRKW